MMSEKEIANEKRVEEPQNKAHEEDRKMKIDVQVERFAVPRPKFTKETWDSGEGGGEGEGEGEGG